MRFIEALGLYLRGCAMGMADLVPGVSGGTLALITGIYERLIGAIASIDLAAIRMVLSGDIVGAWRHVDATFLLLVGSGILSSVFALAHVIEYLVEDQPVLVWSFFSGLLFASLLLMLKIVRPTSASGCAIALSGLLVAVVLSELRALQIPAEGLFVVMGGFIAISAMMLPGISGSFLLLMLGLYQPTLAAVTGLDFGYIALFGVGAAVGFVFFSRFIRFLLQRFHDRTMFFLIGLLAGSLYTTWPWKQLDAMDVPRNISPLALVEPQVGWALTSALLAILLVLGIHWAGSRSLRNESGEEAV